MKNSAYKYTITALAMVANTLSISAEVPASDLPPEIAAAPASAQLAFFILGYHMAKNEKDLAISLPVASIGKTEERIHLEKVINVEANGSIGIDKKTYTLDELEAKMSDLARANKSQSIRLRCDEKTEYKHIVNVINRCSKAGIWNISFATGTPKPEPTN